LHINNPTKQININNKGLNCKVGVDRDSDATKTIQFANEIATFKRNTESQDMGSRSTDMKPMIVIGATAGAAKTLNKTLSA